MAPRSKTPPMSWPPWLFDALHDGLQLGAFLLLDFRRVELILSVAEENADGLHPAGLVLRSQGADA